MEGVVFVEGAPPVAHTPRLPPAFWRELRVARATRAVLDPYRLRLEWLAEGRIDPADYVAPEPGARSS